MANPSTHSACRYSRWALVLVTLAAFFPVLLADFQSYDDELQLMHNPRMQPISVKNTLAHWGDTYGNLYIPVSATAWSVLGLVAEKDPGTNTGERFDPVPRFHSMIFHGANLILHCLNTLIVFLIFQLLFRGNITASLMGALFFSLHPIHVEPVAWVSCLKDLLCAFFSLLAIHRYLKRGKTKVLLDRDYIAITVLFILAALSKPAGVILPIMLVSFGVYYLKKDWKTVGQEAVLWLILCIPFVVITKSLQLDSVARYTVPLWIRPSLALDSLHFYLLKVFAPYPLLIDYTLNPERVAASGQLDYTWCLPVIFISLTWALRKKEPWVVLSVLMFLLPLAPYLGLLQFNQQLRSTVTDKYLYLSVLGPAFGVSVLLNRIKKRTASITVGVLLLGFYFFLSYRQSMLWKNTQTLWTYTAQKNPHSWVAREVLGYRAFRMRNFSLAQEHLQKAIAITPVPKAIFHSALSHIELGQYEKAIEQLNHILKLPGDQKMRNTVQNLLEHAKSQLK